MLVGIQGRYLDLHPLNVHGVNLKRNLGKLVAVKEPKQNKTTKHYGPSSPHPLLSPISPSGLLFLSLSASSASSF